MKPTPLDQALRTACFGWLSFCHALARPNLARIPEPRRITDQDDFVKDYDRVSSTVMMGLYALVLNVIRRSLTRESGNHALDLCCGPGHFTKLLAEHCLCASVTGVDLSVPMLQAAIANAQAAGVSDRASFMQADVQSLDRFASGRFDLVTFMNGAHHLPDLDAVSRTLAEADRVAKADGVVVVFDPVRPNDANLSARYLALAGEDYCRQGLDYFYRDFADSVAASWRADELATAIPKRSERRWLHILPSGFPVYQILLGLPAGRDKPFIRSGFPAATIDALIPRHLLWDWTVLKWTMRLSRKRRHRAVCVLAP